MAQNSRTSAKTNSGGKLEKGNDNGKKDHIRKKAWRPKTKTGCITCRIRRVKCDEGKPSCRRCSSTGRNCDGYSIASPAAQPYTVVYTPKQFSPSSFGGAIPGLDLSSTEEQEAFHFFKYHSASELSGFFDSYFWQFEVLQASHTLPAIRHAIIALAAMHRKFIVGRMPVVREETNDKQLHFALQQTNRAIQEIVKMSARRTLSDKMDMMTACILFHHLACIQGHQRAALEHLRAGLKILAEVDNDIATGQEDVNDHPISLKTLRTMFVSMDVQARGVMTDDMLVTWAPQPKRQFAGPPATFKTFGQARYYFETAFNDVLAFMQELDIHPPTDPADIDNIAKVYQRLQAQFDECSIRLDQFLAQLSQATSQEDRESILGIRLFREQVKVFLRVFKGFNAETRIREIDWHIDEHDMGVILDLASQLLKAPSDLAVPAGAVPEDYYSALTEPENVSKMEIPSHSRPIFSSSSGLLSALWLVTSRAKSSEIRRRAIALLLDFPRREGVWDSVLAGRVAWETLRLEETASEGKLGARKDDLEPRSEYIAEHNKVRDIIIKYVAPRVATIEFRSVKQFEAGERGVTKHIAW